VSATPSYGVCRLLWSRPLVLRPGVRAFFVAVCLSRAGAFRDGTRAAGFLVRIPRLAGASRHPPPEACRRANRRAGTEPQLRAVKGGDPVLRCRRELLRCPSLHDSHRRLAAWATMVCPRRGAGRLRGGRNREQSAAQRQKQTASAVSEKAEIADAGKSGGQNRLQKAAQELLVCQRHDTVLVPATPEPTAVWQCPRCGGRMERRQSLSPAELARPCPAFDSS